jgi:archaellum component FlaC
MTIDERLEKLVERHEALTQTVELISIDIRALEAESRVTTALVREIVGGIRDLGAIARSHEQRLSNLEG